MKGDHDPTKLLHALTWGAFDHASHAPHVRACNYYIIMYRPHHELYPVATCMLLLSKIYAILH